MDIQIGLPATLAMGVCGAVIPLLPVLLWIVWRRRTGAAWLPLGVGVLAMLLPFYVMFLGGMFDEMYGKISIALQALQ